MPFLSDFDHYKIETEILEGGNEVLSYEIVTDAGLGLRNAKFEQRWYRQADIGQGSSSNVWLEVKRGANPETKRAVKVVSKRRLLEINVDYTRELKALTEFSKPKYRQKGLFVDFLGWWDNLDSVFLAMEYFPMGSLEDNISSGLPKVQVIDVMVQLLEGLEIMHAEGFAHRDLKPANIFVAHKDPTWWVKIGDFGISKRIQNQDTSLRTFTGTHDYMAPEFFGYVDGIDDERSDYTHAVDIWALGCVVYKLWTHTVPFPSHSNLRPLQRYCSGRDPFPVEALMSPGCPDVEITIIKALLNVEPSERPSAKAALEMVPHSAAMTPAKYYSLSSQVARSKVRPLKIDRGSASGQAAPITPSEIMEMEWKREQAAPAGKKSLLTPWREREEKEKEPEQAAPRKKSALTTWYKPKQMERKIEQAELDMQRGLDFQREEEERVVAQQVQEHLAKEGEKIRLRYQRRTEMVREEEDRIVAQQVQEHLAKEDENLRLQNQRLHNQRLQNQRRIEMAREELGGRFTIQSSRRDPQR